MYRVFAAISLALTACQPDETISGYVDPAAKYGLVEMGGKPLGAPASIRFPTEGAITGRGPCNSFSASQTVPIPWFRISPIRSTRTACADLKQEAAFFNYLSRMTLIEVSGSVLIMRNDAGEEMVFGVVQE
jgi:heat shock protein HslJ